MPFSSLPYISNAVVLSLDDGRHMKKAAAILQFKPEIQSNHPDLATLRSDLTETTGLFVFKQPTVAYWLREGEEIPLTTNGKISKKAARQTFFGDRWQCKDGVEVLDLKEVEYWRMERTVLRGGFYFAENKTRKLRVGSKYFGTFFA